MKKSLIFMLFMVTGLLFTAVSHASDFDVGKTDQNVESAVIKTDVTVFYSTIQTIDLAFETKAIEVADYNPVIYAEVDERRQLQDDFNNINSGKDQIRCSDHFKNLPQIGRKQPNSWKGGKPETRVF